MFNMLKDRQRATAPTNGKSLAWWLDQSNLDQAVFGSLKPTFYLPVSFTPPSDGATFDSFGRYKRTVPACRRHA